MKMYFLFCTIVFLNATQLAWTNPVNFTYPIGTAEKGAVCLDGIHRLISLPNAMEMELMIGLFIWRSSFISNSQTVAEIMYLKNGSSFEYFVGDIQTPLFMVQSAYDQFQIVNRTKLEMPAANWSSCYYNISLCPSAEVKAMRDFATTLVKALPGNSSSRGLFVDSCSVHGQVLDDDKWHNVPEPTLRNRTIAQAVADCFFDRSSFQVIQKADFPYSCPANLRK